MVGIKLIQRTIIFKVVLFSGYQKGSKTEETTQEE